MAFKEEEKMSNIGPKKLILSLGVQSTGTSFGHPMEEEKEVLVIV